jgi:O-6-methylguanine DNA methyltransferase
MVDGTMKVHRFGDVFHKKISNYKAQTNYKLQITNYFSTFCPPASGLNYLTKYKRYLEFLSMDILYTDRLKTFLGMITLVFTLNGLQRVIFEKDEKCTKSSQEELSLNSIYLKQFNEYFGGERKEFDFPLDISGTTFQEKVWEFVHSIPFGETISYQGVAERIGHPNAQRAVGNALRQNPIPIVIPCHRVIQSNRDLGGFTGGIEIKRKLLEFEALNK